MSWLSNFIHGKTKTPDTSVQDAEAQRQYDQMLQLLTQQYTDEQARWEQQRADDQARYDQQYQLQLSQAADQKAAYEAEIKRQIEAQQRAEANAASERAAQEAQAAQRAQEARAYATGRQALLDQGTANIENAYSGFNSSFFDNFAKKFVDYYKPQLEREATDANHKVVYGYAESGGLRSSAHAKAQGDLQRGKDEKSAMISSAATDAANSFQNDIIGQKNQAISSIFDAAGAASPILPDGTIDSGSALQSLGSQINATTSAATKRAQGITIPSFTGNKLDLSLTGYAKRPTQYGVAT